MDCLTDLGVAIYAVHGNCDMYFVLDANEKIFDEVKGGLLLTHGHQYNVKSGMSRLVAEAKQQRVSTVVFGHTHQPLFVNLDGILLLNPGSISAQKSGGHPTYAVLETNSEGDIIRAEIRLLFYKALTDTEAL